MLLLVVILGWARGWRWGWRKRAVTLLALTSLNSMKPSAGHGAGASFFKPDRRSGEVFDGIPALLDRAVAEFGHIDILVNNAGLIRREDALEFSEKDGTMS